MLKADSARRGHGLRLRRKQFERFALQRAAA
jgi:hypothetical protein